MFGLSSETVRQYLSEVNKLIAYLETHHSQMFTSASVEDYLQTRNNNLSSSSIEKVNTVIRTYNKYLIFIRTCNSMISLPAINDH